jgi:hypothetical protein
MLLQYPNSNSELEICLELPPSQIRSFEGGVSLPTSRYEEDGLYYFLALASHRKLLMDIVDSSGFDSRLNYAHFLLQNLLLNGRTAGAMVYAPLVTQELRSQLQDWYFHLPPTLKFPLDSSPIFDPRKANLRSQFYASMAVISWPFILEMVDMSRDRATETSPNQEHILTKQDRAAEYLENCCIYIRVSEGTLMKKCMVSHITLRS